MATRLFLLIMLTLGVGLPSIAHAQEDNNAQIEQDYSITSVEDRRRAITDLTNESNQLRQSGQIVEAARALNRAGRFQMRLTQMEEAVTTFQAALGLLETQPDIKTRIDSLNGLASSYENLSKCERAAPTANQAVTLSAENHYVAGEAEAHLTISFCQNLKDHALALESAHRSLDLWRSINRKRGIAEVHMAMYQYHLAQNDLTEASKDLEIALSLYRELNSIERQTTILIYSGYLEYRKGAWQNALSYHTRAQSLVDENNEPYKMGMINSGLGEAFLEVGMPEVAEAKFREALQQFTAAKNERGALFMKWSIGKALYFSAKYKETLETLLPARKEAVAADDITLVAFFDDYLGRAYAALNETPAALNYFQSAIRGYSSAKNPRELARTRAFVGEIYQGQGEFETARAHYQSALNDFRRLSDRVNESAALFALGRLDLQQGRLDSAESYLRNSIEVTENVRRISTSRDLAAAFSATVHDRYESYVECLMRKHQTNPAVALDVRAFETSELARARSLAELLRATQANLIASLDPALAEREMSLRQSLRTTEDSRVAMLAGKHKKEELDALDTQLARLESEYKQVTETIRARYPGYEQVTRPNPLTLSQIQSQALVDDQTLLLEYSLGTERSYLWAVTRSEISSYELPGRAQIENEARRFYDLLTAGQLKQGVTVDQIAERLRQAEAELPAAGANLSKTLLGPVADKLGTKRLIIVADGALQYIPFQTLTSPARANAGNLSSTTMTAEGRPLILDHEIINEPSASILAFVRAETANRKLPRGSVAVLADPVFNNDDPRIQSPRSSQSPAPLIAPNEAVAGVFRDIGQTFDSRQIPRLLASREEAKAIMHIVPWRTGFEAVDFEANREIITGSQLFQYRIIHFATHAFFDDKHPESSGILLSLVNQKGVAQDGFLRLNDVYNLNLPVNLVVLSACNTGLGKDVKGEGLIGLTRGFMYAGASGVAASLWKVDDEATAELMKLFYEGMFNRGLTPAAALREAQISMLHQKRWHAPFYWAAFVIQGQYDQQVSAGLTGPGHLYYWIFAIGIVGVVSLTGYILIRRRRKKIL